MRRGSAAVPEGFIHLYQIRIPLIAAKLDLIRSGGDNQGDFLRREVQSQIGLRIARGYQRHQVVQRGSVEQQPPQETNDKPKPPGDLAVVTAQAE